MIFTEADLNRFRRAIPPFASYDFKNGTVGCGSSALIDKISDDTNLYQYGLYLTANHVVKPDGVNFVAFDDFDGCAPRFAPAIIINVDPSRDLAAFGCCYASERDAQDLRPFELADSEPLHFDVVSGGWGNPYGGDRFALATGRMIALDALRLHYNDAYEEFHKVDFNRYVGYIGTTRSGDSGGAVFRREDGRLAGIVLGVVWEFHKKPASANFSYCCPVDELRDFVAESKKKFRIEIDKIQNGS